MPPPSPARPTRKSLSALPSSLASAAGSASSANLALPPSAAASSSSSAGSSSSKPKALPKRAASFAPGDVGPARVAVFGQRDEVGAKAPAALSPRKVARRALVPRKSILKTYNPDDVTLNFTTGQIGLGRQRSPAVADSEDEDEDDDDDETQFRRLPGESTTRMLDRRVSFAAHAHVRMFEIDAGRNPALSQSTSSVGSTSTTASNPPSPAPPKLAPPPPTAAAAANMFAGAPTAPAQAATGTRRRSSTGTTAASALAEETTPGGASRRRSSAASFASEGSADMSMDEDDNDEDDGDEMEMTQAVGGIQAAPPAAAADDNTPFSPSASTLSAHSDDDDDLAAGGPRDDEDRTMDFTVATGGIIPPSAPASADANVRRSLGYGVEEDEARRLNTWFATQQAPAQPARTSREQAAARAAAEEMEGYDDADDDGMELTTAQGGIVFGSAPAAAVVAGRGPDESTDEVEMDLDDDGGMDYTTAAGGIFGSAPAAAADDDETEEVDADAMDFTVAGGGISGPAPAADDETANLDFTTAGGGIFGGSSGRASLSAPASRQSLGGRSPAKSPRKSAAQGGPAPTPTRPIASSLSRPTASSAAKAKAFTPSASGSGGAGGRNLFESPAKQRATAQAAAAAASPAASRKRAATDDVDAAAAVFGKSPAKRRASAATSVAGPRARAGDVFGQPPAAAAAGEPEEVDPTPPALTAPTNHSIFSPVKNAFSSIFSPKASPAPAAPAASTGAKATFPTSLFGSPLARAPNPPAQEAPAGPSPPEINIFSTSPQAAPPPALSASFSGAAGLFNPSPDEVLAEADAAFDAEVEQQQERETTPPPSLEQAQVPPARTREETATPSKKRLGRPSLAVAGAGGAGTSADRAAQDAAAADDEDADEMFQPEPVSLNQFLDMTGLSFMTNITAGRRRSTIQPGELLGLHRKATEGTGRSGGDYSLVHYAHHVLNMQDYVVYHWACNNLREATEKSRHVVQVLDEEASLANPLLFTEYLEADDDEKRMIETQLKHLKTYAQHTVKKRWLEWRLDILTPLRAGHENDKADLLEDRARLAEAGAAFAAETDLVALRARHAALRLQLAQEKKKVENVQACDQQELAHRRSDIQEQKDQIDGVKSEMHDVGVILASLQAKKESILGQKKTYLDAIEFGKHASAGSFTAERLSELEDEVRTLEFLHSVQLTERSATHVELVILADLKLVLACEDFVPTSAGATVELVGSTKTRRNPELAQRLFGLVQRVVDEDRFDSVPALVQKVHQLWLATVQLTHELHLIRLRYPVSYSSSAPPVVRASATVMICPIKAKFVVSFDLTADVLARWPASTAAIAVGVDVQYSRADVKADSEVLKQVIVGRLQNADQRAGALVDGCLDAVGRYC